MKHINIKRHQIRIILILALTLFIAYCLFVFICIKDYINISHQLFQQTITIVCHDLAHKVRSRNIELFNLENPNSYKMTQNSQNKSNYVHPDLFKGKYIDSLLQFCMKQANIPLKYDYIILNQDSIITQNAPIDFKNLSKYEYIHTYILSSNLIKTSPYILKIYFPNMDVTDFNFIKKRKILIIGALFIIVLSLLTISLSHSEMIILKKKNFSIFELSHELKTPISTIRLSLDALSDNTIISNKNSRDYYLNIMKEENNRMKLMVDHFLTNVIPHQKIVSLSMQDADIHDILKQVTSHNTIRISSVNGSYSMNLKAHHHIVEGNAEYLYNIFNNLIDNAIKYSPKNPEIQITSYIKNHNIAISIKDNGIGIAKNNLSLIFKDTYRVSQNNTSNIKGFRLGLSYVKKMVNLHHGTITVTSKLNNGSIFTL